MSRKLALFTIKMVGLVAIVALSEWSCSQNPTGKSEPVDSVKADAPAEPATVRRSIPFAGTFSQVNNMCSIDCIFTVGEHRIEAEGPAELVKLVRVTVDSGTLTITYNYDNNPDINVFKRTGSSVKVYVSAPSLRIVSACGTGSFRACGRLDTEEFMAGTLSSGNIEIDTLVCHGPFRYESKNTGKGTFRCLVTQQKADFINDGIGSITVDSLAASSAVLVNHSGESTTSIHGTAPSLEVWAFSRGNVEAEMDVDELTVKAFDDSNVQFKGTYRNETVKRGDNATIVINQASVQ